MSCTCTSSTSSTSSSRFDDEEADEAEEADDDDRACASRTHARKHARAPSMLVVQVGQAGNAIGYHVWARVLRHAVRDTYTANAASSSASAASPIEHAADLELSARLACSEWIHRDGYAHAILVDTEPKVIQSIRTLSLAAIVAQLEPPRPPPPNASSLSSLSSSTSSASSLASRRKSTGGVSASSSASAARRMSTGSNSTISPSGSSASTTSSSTKSASGATTAAADDVAAQCERAAEYQRLERPIFRASQCFLDQYGRGNNWAMGYRGRSRPNLQRGAQRGHRRRAQDAAVHDLDPDAMADDDDDGDIDDIDDNDDVDYPARPRTTPSTTSNNGSSRASPPIPPTHAMLDDIMRGVQTEVERMDHLHSILLLHSCAGGTGAGLGSHLAEELRRAYPHVCIVSTTVLPFLSGETPLQHYNTMLTLAHLQRHVDGMILLNNQDVIDVIGAAMHRNSPNPVLSLPYSVINGYLADCILDTIAPTRDSRSDAAGLADAHVDIRSLVSGGGGSAGGSAGSSSSSSSSPPYPVASASRFGSPVSAFPVPLHSFSLPELVRYTCPVPATKLVETWTSSGLIVESAHEPLTWSTMVDILYRTVPRTDLDDPHTPSRALLYSVYARARDLADLPTTDERLKLCARLDRFVPCVSWNPFARHLIGSPVAPMSSLHARSLTVCLNRTRHASYLHRVWQRATTMFAHRTFAHWYERFACDAEQMQDAFATVEEVVQAYREWTR